MRGIIVCFHITDFISLFITIKNLETDTREINQIVEGHCNKL